MDLEQGKKYALVKVVKEVLEISDDDILPDDDSDLPSERYLATFADISDAQAAPIEKEFPSISELRKFLKRFDGGSIVKRLFCEHIINTVKQKFAEMAKEKPSKMAIFNFTIGNTTKEVSIKFFDRWDEKINELFSAVPNVKEREKAFAQAMDAVKKGFLGDESTAVKLRFPAEDEDEEDFLSFGSSSDSGSKARKMEIFEMKKFDDWNERADTYWWTYGMPDDFVTSYIQHKRV